MKHILIVIILVSMLIGSVAWGCEVGKTYKDTGLSAYCDKPTSQELSVSNLFPDKVFYFTLDNDKKYFYGLLISEELEFDKNGMIKKYTGYTWCGMVNPPPKGEEPYVLYKGHRWYPNYHGIIYLYQDGHEQK